MKFDQKRFRGDESFKERYFPPIADSFRGAAGQKSVLIVPIKSTIEVPGQQVKSFRCVWRGVKVVILRGRITVVKEVIHRKPMKKVASVEVSVDDGV